MPAYMVVQATVTKPEQFTEYAERMPALVEKFGGKYRVLGEKWKPWKVTGATRPWSFPNGRPWTRPAGCGIPTNMPN